jgi:hypothetical protein
VGAKCSACGSRKETKRASKRSQCDALASLICKYLGGFVCFRCGKPGSPNAKGERIVGLDWSHRPYAKRSHSRAIRWDEDAADCACRECHRYLETRPVEYNALLVKKGVDIADGERRAHLLWDKQFPIVKLKARLNELKEKP